MKHSFVNSPVDKGKCGICGYNVLSHTKMAKCEACDKQGKCEIYPEVKHKNAMLLCETCIEKEIAVDNKPKAITKCQRCGSDEDLSVKMRYHNLFLCDGCSAYDGQLTKENGNIVINTGKTLKEVVKIDNSIRFSTDLFNAETVSIAEIKKIIWADESLSDAEKHVKLQEMVLERVEKFSHAIRKLDDEKIELIAKKQAGIHALREFGNSLRNEIRERIKAADETYRPAPIVKPPKISKPKESPIERMIQMFMTMKGVDRETAEKFVLKKE